MEGVAKRLPIFCAIFTISVAGFSGVALSQRKMDPRLIESQPIEAPQSQEYQPSDKILPNPCSCPPTLRNAPVPRYYMRREQSEPMPPVRRSIESTFRLMG